MIKLNKTLFAGLLSISLMGVPFSVSGAQVNDIEKLERQLIEIETKLLESGLKVDILQEDRSKYDGISGLFKGKKKKAIEAKIREENKTIKELGNTSKKIAAQVQKKVYDVAYTFEQNGQYKKALEFYFKVEKQTDKVKERIAICYKGMKDYPQAIKWFLSLPKTDSNLLRVVDCYKLDKKIKEAVYWLFEIIENLDENAAEEKALKLIEQYDYPARKKDYPQFFQRLADVYTEKSTRAYSKDFNKSSKYYRKAVDLLAQDSDLSSEEISSNILKRHYNKHQTALEILDRQKVAAERNYQDKLRRARADLDEALRRLDRAKVDAENDYNYQLSDAQDKVQRARRNLSNLTSSGIVEKAQRNLEKAIGEAERAYIQKLSNADAAIVKANNKIEELKKDAATTPEQLQRAKQRLLEAQQDQQELKQNHDSIIKKHLAPYRDAIRNAKDQIQRAERRVRQARDDYEYILRNRTSIINKFLQPYREKVRRADDYHEKIIATKASIIATYLAPYERDVRNTKRAYARIKSLHEANFK